MKFLKTTYLLLGLLASTLIAETKQERGSLVFSYMKTQSAFSSKELPKTGIEIYTKSLADPHNPGSLITVVEYRNGEEIETDRIYERNDEFIQRLRRIGLKSFDAKKEIQQVLEGGTSSYASLDGYEYKIVYDLDDQRVELNEWNIEGMIDHYSSDSESFSKLKAVINECALQFGRMRLN